MSDLWLTPEEVEELTACKRWTAQCRALAQMGVPFQPNRVGRPLVERAAVTKAPVRPRGRKEPKWDAIKSRAA